MQQRNRGEGRSIVLRENRRGHERRRGTEEDRTGERREEERKKGYEKRGRK